MGYCDWTVPIAEAPCALAPELGEALWRELAAPPAPAPLPAPSDTGLYLEHALIAGLWLASVASGAWHLAALHGISFIG